MCKRKDKYKVYKDYLKDEVKKGERCKEGFKPCGIVVNDPFNSQQNINSNDFDSSNFLSNQPNQNINGNQNNNGEYSRQQGFSSGGYTPN